MSDQLQIPLDKLQNYRWLAEIMEVLGDNYTASNIFMGLYEHSSKVNSQVGPNIEIGFAFSRTAQSLKQLAFAKNKVLPEIIRTLSHHHHHYHQGNNSNEDDCPTWSHFQFDLNFAHVTDRESPGSNNALSQLYELFAEKIRPIGNDAQRHFMSFSPRTPNLLFDVPIYLAFVPAATRYDQAPPEYYMLNEPAPEESFDDEEVDEPNFSQLLEWFRNQQLVFSHRRCRASCLADCLTWCMKVLEHPSLVPQALETMITNPEAHIYIVLCTILQEWLRQHAQQERFAFRPATANHGPRELADLKWVTTARTQLDLSPPQFLTVIVCMIMAEASQQSDTVASRHDLSCALLFRKASCSAGNLKSLPHKDLFNRFLKNTTAIQYLHVVTSHPEQPTTYPQQQQDWINALPQVHNPPTTDSISSVALLAPFREFIAQILTIDNLPPLDLHIPVYPLTLDMSGGGGDAFSPPPSSLESSPLANPQGSSSSGHLEQAEPGPSTAVRLAIRT